MPHIRASRSSDFRAINQLSRKSFAEAFELYQRRSGRSFYPSSISISSLFLTGCPVSLVFYFDTKDEHVPLPFLAICSQKAYNNITTWNYSGFSRGAFNNTTHICEYLASEPIIIIDSHKQIENKAENKDEWPFATPTHSTLRDRRGHIIILMRLTCHLCPPRLSLSTHLNWWPIKRRHTQMETIFRVM